jgi:DNA-binding XRE family transcriptional regulator
VLKQCGLLACYNFSSDYPEPGDRGRGWVERWLKAKVYLTTPEALAKLEQEPQQATPRLIKRRVRGLGKTKKPLVRGQYLDAATVAAIYEAYKSRNWTQATFAKELKIARPTLSNVLNGKEAPSAGLANRIRAFLDSPKMD